jgi:hypothetical protein
MREVWSDKIPAEVILVACDLERENAELRAETLEQARLLGISGDWNAPRVPIWRCSRDEERSLAISEGGGHGVCGLARELLAENAELRKDKARLDWLETDGESVSDYRDHCWREWLVSTINTPLKPDASVRAAIDAAMEETK